MLQPNTPSIGINIKTWLCFAALVAYFLDSLLNVNLEGNGNKDITIHYLLHCVNYDNATLCDIANATNMTLNMTLIINSTKSKYFISSMIIKLFNYPMGCIIPRSFVIIFHFLAIFKSKAFLMSRLMVLYKA